MVLHAGLSRKADRISMMVTMTIRRIKSATLSQKHCQGLQPSGFEVCESSDLSWAYCTDHDKMYMI